MKTLKDNLKKRNEVMIANKRESKTGYDLMKHFGVLKGDTEYDMLKKEIKAAWRKWTNKYKMDFNK